MEDNMDRLPFEIPVCIKIGSTTREVKTVRGACECLIDWPHGRRGPIYQTAMRACEAALAGDVSVECARSAFLGFARVSGILVKETTAVIPPPEEFVVAAVAAH
jgi:hypothetical protein